MMAGGGRFNGRGGRGGGGFMGGGRGGFGGGPMGRGGWGGTGNYQPRHVLFVHGLPPNMDETLLQQLFAPYGPIQKVDVVRDEERNNQCKGFGFVTYVKKESGDAAIKELHEFQIGENTSSQVENGKHQPPEALTAFA